MKRFTVVEKWQDPWFRPLPPRLKCLWSYLCDNCDNLGIIEIDWDDASFRIGEKVGPEDLKYFERQIRPHRGRKHLIVKFIEVQWPRLSNNSPPNRAILEALKREGIPVPVPVKETGNGELKHTPTPPTRTTSTAPNTADGIRIRLQRGLNRMFGRNDENRWTYAEETALVQVASRKDCLKELQVIGQYRETAEYPHKSVLTVLENWNTILDQAHSEGIEYREKFNVPTSERYTACGLVWNRTDGGPKREQFNGMSEADDAFELCRNGYNDWLKKCKPIEQAV